MAEKIKNAFYNSIICIFVEGNARVVLFVNYVNYDYGRVAIFFGVNVSGVVKV